jgi:hypothetical protein
MDTTRLVEAIISVIVFLIYRRVHGGLICGVDRDIHSHAPYNKVSVNEGGPIRQCFSTTGPWLQLYRAARGKFYTKYYYKFLAIRIAYVNENQHKLI